MSEYNPHEGYDPTDPGDWWKKPPESIEPEDGPLKPLEERLRGQDVPPGPNPRTVSLDPKASALTPELRSVLEKQGQRALYMEKLARNALPATAPYLVVEAAYLWANFYRPDVIIVRPGPRAGGL